MLNTAVHAATIVVRRKSFDSYETTVTTPTPRAPLPQAWHGCCCTSSNTEAAITRPNHPTSGPGYPVDAMTVQIPFTRGVPSVDILPVAELREAASKALEREPALALSYSSGAGHPG